VSPSPVPTAVVTFPNISKCPPPLSLHASRPLVHVTCPDLSNRPFSVDACVFPPIPVTRPLVTRAFPTYPTDIPSRATCPDIFNCPPPIAVSRPLVTRSVPTYPTDIPSRATCPDISTWRFSIDVCLFLPFPVSRPLVTRAVPTYPNDFPSRLPPQHPHPTRPDLSDCPPVPSILPPSPPLTSPDISSRPPVSLFSARGPFVRPSQYR